MSSRWRSSRLLMTSRMEAMRWLHRYTLKELVTKHVIRHWTSSDLRCVHVTCYYHDGVVDEMVRCMLRIYGMYIEIDFKFHMGIAYVAVCCGIVIRSCYASWKQSLRLLVTMEIAKPNDMRGKEAIDNILSTGFERNLLC